MCDSNTKDCWSLKDSKQFFTQDASSLREISILSNLKHKNVMNIFMAGIEKDHFYYTMPLAKDNLTNLLKGGIPETKKLDYTIQLLEGMQYLASKDVIHLDLKPSNILVSSGDTLKIADFGLSVMLKCSHPSLDNYNVVTPVFRAPEIFCKYPYTINSDKWSVGCIIYQIYTNEYLFNEFSEDRILLYI